MLHDNLIYELSKQFALRIIKLYRYLTSQKHEYMMAGQIYRSGTSIGANIAESQNAQSIADFVSKLSIALKEADETRYWLDLLHDSDVISDKEYEDIYQDASKIVGTLIKIIKKTKGNSMASDRLSDSTCPSAH